MSETTMTNINEKDKKTESATNMGDNSNQGFPAFIIGVIMLACIWMLAGFTVFTCTIVIVLVIKLAQISNSNSTTNNNETKTPSSSQVCMNGSSRARNGIISDLSATIHDPTTINVRESEAELDRDGQHRETVTTEMEQQRSNDDFDRQDVNSGVLANGIAQMSQSDANYIDDLISKDDTVAVLITPTDDSRTNTPSPVQTTAGTAVPAIPSNTSTTAEPIRRESAFVTENVMKIAVSYSGKERKRVLKITRILQNSMTTPQCPHPVFFDQDFQHEICRLNGLNHLLRIYRQAQLVVVFLSPTYTDSRYCTGEWRTIAQRFLSNRKNKEATQVLLIKLGKYDMEQLDLVDNDFAVNGMRRSNEEIANIILRRWEIVQKNLEQSEQ